MTSYDLAEVLLEELGYADSPGFERSISRENRWPIPEVDSAYSVQNIPVAYFSRLRDAHPEHLRQLHRHV
jgi:hypothetical protein